ncbi:hypothetical protein NXF98_22870, partial [Klebsiella pneumoniae]|nr:hypothetical protein [Klebsiella pneumoniae]
KSAQIREILISESAWEEMTCLFAPSLAEGVIKDLYSNGMGYNQMAFSAALSPTLVTYKAIEGDLQGIDHPG